MLTDGPLITVKSPDIAPGLSATLTLTFKSAGEVTAKVPVMDGNEPQYADHQPGAQRPAPSRRGRGGAISPRTCNPVLAP